MRLLAIVLLLVYAGVCAAQQKFKLHQAGPESNVSQCFERQAAIDIADAGNSFAREAIFRAYFKTGTCVIMTSVASYSHQIYRNGDYRVYEGRVGTVTVFTPTSWIGTGEDEL